MTQRACDNCKKCKKRSAEAELELAERAFREALRGGDSAGDAFLYAQLSVESVKLDG